MRTCLCSFVLNSAAALCHIPPTVSSLSFSCTPGAASGRLCVGEVRMILAFLTSRFISLSLPLVLILYPLPSWSQATQPSSPAILPITARSPYLRSWHPLVPGTTLPDTQQTKTSANSVRVSVSDVALADLHCGCRSYNGLGCCLLTARLMSGSRTSTLPHSLQTRR